MAVCDECLRLLGHEIWHAETSDWELNSLVQSCTECPMCRHLCAFFEIPIDAIRAGVEWPSVEQVTACPIDDRRALRPKNGQKLIVSIQFKVTGHKDTLLKIWARMIPKGRSYYYPAAPESVCLPLGKSSTYNQSDATLGVCINESSGNIANRGIWSHPAPVSIAARISTVIDFLKECPSNHPRCTGKTDDHGPCILPSRFVDVGSEKEGVEPKLVVTDSGISPTERYTTLSHCWGANPEIMPLRTLKLNKDAHLSAISMSTLPRTFRDAVSVTRALGIRYIWIDSLCIVQDDLQDWEQEAAKMASIYENSFLTIAAVDSPNSHGGLYLDNIAPSAHIEFTPEIKTDKKKRQANPQVTSEKITYTAHFRELERPRSNQDRLHLYNAPLYKRGWVFQEVMLSKRSIHFREHQLYWKCPSGLRSEDGTLDETSSKEAHSLLNFFDQVGGRKNDFSTPARATTTWWEWVENYTTRSLTRADDRTAAITGILRQFERITQRTPLLGLWAGASLVPDLGWYTGGAATTKVPHPIIGPSWSWLSHHSQVVGNQMASRWGERQVHALEPRLAHFEANWSGSPFTSTLLSSTLHLHAVIRTFPVRAGSPRWTQGFHVAHPTSSGSDGEVDCTFDDGTLLTAGMPLTALFLFYAAEHIETEDYHGSIRGESLRREYFLIVEPDLPAGHSAAAPIVIPDHGGAPAPKRYRRLGVGSFEVMLTPKYEWSRKKRPYSNISSPNPPLLFDSVEAVIELV